MGQGTTREVEAGKGTMTHAPNVKTIENATRDDVRPGDHIVWEQTEVRKGVTRTVRREGIAHHRDSFGAWWTEDRGLITNSEGIALTLRRTVTSEESAL